MRLDRFPEFLRDESEQRKGFEAPKSELFGAYVDCAGRTGQRRSARKLSASSCSK